MAELNISLLVPLFLLVVPALANVSRQVTLIEIANDSHDDVYLLQGSPIERYLRPIFELSLSPGEKVAASDDTEKELSGVEPKFGRFNHIHAFNSFLLAASLSLVAHSMASINGLLLAGVIGVFWMVLPIIEVNEYDLMMRHFEPTDELFSLAFHMITTGLLTLPTMALALIDVTTYPPLYRGTFILIYLTVGVLTGNFYQTYLREELETLRQRGITQNQTPQ